RSRSRGWSNWCWCWRWWRSHALAVFQLFRWGADWQIAAWYGVSRGPVAGAPAQAERITGDNAARILHIGALRSRSLDVLGDRSEWRRGWLVLCNCQAGQQSRSGEHRSDQFFHIVVVLSWGETN